MDYYWDAFLADLKADKIPGHGWSLVEDRRNSIRILLEAFYEWLTPRLKSQSPTYQITETSWAFEGITIHVAAGISMGNSQYESHLDSPEVFERIKEQWIADMTEKDINGMNVPIEWLRDCLEKAIQPVNAEIEHLVQKDPSAKE